MLPEDINTLQHENMGMQTAITIALEQKKAVLESAAAKALLTIDNFDAAVNTALQIIEESLDCDRQSRAEGDRIQAVITALKRGIVSLQ